MKYLLSLLLVISSSYTVLNAKGNINDDDLYALTSVIFGIAKNEEKDKAFSLLVKRLDRDPRANYYFGLLLQYGLGFKKNAKDALAAYKKAIKLCREQNNTADIVLPLHAAGILLAVDKKDTKHRIEGIRYLDQASDLGYDRSTYDLAGLLSNDPANMAKPQTRKKLIALYKKLLGSKKYRAIGLMGLGSLYQMMKVPKYKEARMYLLEAAHVYKERLAYQLLADLYDRNDTTFKNKQQSNYWRTQFYTDGLSIEFEKQKSFLEDAIQKALSKKGGTYLFRGDQR